MSNRSLRFRRDTRTKKQFEEDILKRTLKQKFLATIFIAEMIGKGHKIKVTDYGVDNSGQVVEKEVECLPDYQAWIDGKEYLLELKNAPYTWKWTFKVHSLEEYVKQSSHVLLFYGTGFIDDDPKKISYEETKWTIISPDGVQRMLDKGYKQFKHPSFGYKYCIEVPEKDFFDYISHAYPIEHFTK